MRIYLDCCSLQRPFDDKYLKKDKIMKINIIYKEINGWFLGHVQEYPDYESQGRTLEELQEILMEIYDNIGTGLVPNAERFQVLEAAT